MVDVPLSCSFWRGYIDTKNHKPLIRSAIPTNKHLKQPATTSHFSITRKNKGHFMSTNKYNKDKTSTTKFNQTQKTTQPERQQKTSNLQTSTAEKEKTTLKKKTSQNNPTTPPQKKKTYLQKKNTHPNSTQNKNSPNPEMSSIFFLNFFPAPAVRPRVLRNLPKNSELRLLWLRYF